jgi:hypothetical protein
MQDKTAESKPTALQRLLNEQKGKTAYSEGEAFLLHVFWEAPSEMAAQRLLDALRKCAEATHRDTPCVPTYFFRISNNDKLLYGDAPTRVENHVQLAAAIKKIQVGVPRMAVAADLRKRGIDPEYLNLDLSDELPPSLRGQTPIALEFTEVYLDERAFMEHAGSRDYLENYGIVMSPGLYNRKPTTLRLGNPSQNLIDTVLEPMLHETVVSLDSYSTVWRKPERWSESHFLISIDLPSTSFETCDFPSQPQEYFVWSVHFAHPIRDEVSRFMAVVPSWNELTSKLFEKVALLRPLQGEIHVANDDVAVPMQCALTAAGLTSITVNATRSVGYILHEKAADLQIDH